MSDKRTIHNITDLKVELERETVAAIRKLLYNYTTCGITFDEIPDGVSVCGYAEGADAECIPQELGYPFTVKDFWEAVDQADYEGCELYDEWNISEAEAIEAEDNKQRAEDMNHE